MFKKKKEYLWTEQDFYKYNILANGQALKKLAQEFIGQDIASSLNINTPYPLISNLGGVPIEIGELIIKKTELEEILWLLQSFVIPQNDTKFIIKQNIESVIKWAKTQNLEIPDPQACEGYIFNNELINFFHQDDIMNLEFKYKDHIENPFIIYRIAFFKTHVGYFIFLGKYF